jgi:cell division protease FtsH
MRRLRAFRARLAKLLRERLVAVLVLAGALLVLFGGTLAAPGPQGRGDDLSPEIVATYSTSWSLIELQRHIEAGEVLSLTAIRSETIEIEGAEPTTAPGVGAIADALPASGATLLAVLTDGQRVPVDLSVTYREAFDAMRSLGYGRLLTAEAEAARTNPSMLPADQLPGSNMSFWRPENILPIGGWALLMSAFFVWSSRRGRARAGGSGIRTILPGRRTARAAQGAAGPSASGSDSERDELPRGLVRFEQVAGCDEAKEELREAIEFLRDPERFRRLGAEVPRGVLFWGPPGTGKTMLARAVAGEADVPFTYASGSEFVEMYVGVGAARVRKLFEEAKAHGAGVVFIDEIDALAKKRGGANSNDEREQALNQLLVEMDGFATDERIIVIAATNRLDTLDSAVLRPGRFTRKIHIGLPDRDARRAILGVHAANKPIGPDVDLDAVARRTAGFSGAQLADLLNEAAIMAARRGASTLDATDVRAGFLKSAVGTSRRRSMNDRERSIIAAHEAGHAICGRVWGDLRRVEEISLYQHGEALGVTVSSSEDNSLPAESDLQAMLVALMGGRVAEELLFTEVTGGASNDFEKASEIARLMVTRWGMGADPGDRTTSPSGRGALSVLVADEVSGEIRTSQDRAIRAILDAAYANARSTLLSERERLNRVAAYLFEHERIDGDEFASVFEGRLMPSSDQIGAWRDAAAKPREWSEIDEWAEAALRREPPLGAPVFANTTPATPESALTAYPVEIAKALALLPVDLARSLAEMPVEAVREALKRAERRSRKSG